LFEQGALSRYTQNRGSDWLIEEVSTKPYSSGRASHAVLGTLDALLSEGQIISEKIASIDAHVPPLIRRLVDRPMAPDMTPSYARLCLPWLTALMLSDGRIDPRRFTGESFASLASGVGASLLSILPDENSDPNALEPQRVTIHLKDGRRIERQVEHMLGSPEAPMSEHQAAAKRALVEELAGDVPDRRLLDDPLAYFTVPQ
jgi:2-methylcitrate dehydratase PrpD